MIVIDKDHRVVYANEAAAHMCESSIKRMINKKTIVDLFAIEEATLAEKIKSIKPGIQIELQEVSLVRASGTRVKVQMAAQGFATDGQEQAIIIARDVTLEEVLHGKYRKELEQKEAVITKLKEAQLELEKYSKNLEAMVASRTSELRMANQMLSAVMNSLGQGFLTFGRDGMCSDIFTRACLEILETNPANKKVWDVLRLEGKAKSQFEQWIQLVFNETLPFESLKELGPNQYVHTNQKFVTLDFFPIRSADSGAVTDVVMVATDQTAEREAQIALEKEKQHANLVMKMIQHRLQFRKFLESFPHRIAEVKSLLLENNPDLNAIFRHLHTMEGEAGLFGLFELRVATRAPQEILEPYKQDSIVLDFKAKAKMVESLDSLQSVMRTFKQAFSEALKALRITDGEWIEIKKDDLMSVFDKLAPHGMNAELADKVLTEIAKVPLSALFAHFNEICETVAFRQGKKVNPILFTGATVLVSKDRLNDLIASLVHAFRNVVDHGIETPEDRSMTGKSAEGNIEVRFSQSAHSIKIAIKDDGAGVDPNRIRKKLKEKFAHEDFSKESDAQVIQHIFDPGFSTREEVGEFSGRGVGMDAVRTEVEKLGGKVTVTSTIGEGTTLVIEIPDSPPQSAVSKSA